MKASTHSTGLKIILRLKILVAFKGSIYNLYYLDPEFKNSRFRHGRMRTGLDRQQASPAGLQSRRAFYSLTNTLCSG